MFENTLNHQTSQTNKEYAQKLPPYKRNAYAMSAVYPVKDQEIL